MATSEIDLAVAIGRRSSFCSSAAMLELLMTLTLVSGDLQRRTYGDAFFLEAAV